MRKRIEKKMNIENDERKELNDEQMEKVNGGFFVASGADTGNRGTSGNLNVTLSYYCKACSHSWTSDQECTTCPSCGATELYTVAY